MELYPTTVNITSSAGFDGNKAKSSSSQPLQPDASRHSLIKADQVSISGEAKKNDSSEQLTTDKTSAHKALAEPPNLDNQDLAQLRNLKRRDLEVRNHEQAHLSAAGKYAKGGISLVYQKGPDGASYAVGGEVSIDVSAESSPEATIAKMQTIKRAALAPLNPSPADRGIAAQAASKEAAARQQLIGEQHENLITEASLADKQQFSNSSQASKSDLFITSGIQESVSIFNTVA